MAVITYFVVITFDRTDAGELVAGQPVQIQSAEAARRRAATLA